MTVTPENYVYGKKDSTVTPDNYVYGGKVEKEEVAVTPDNYTYGNKEASVTPDNYVYGGDDTDKSLIRKAHEKASGVTAVGASLASFPVAVAGVGSDMIKVLSDVRQGRDVTKQLEDMGEKFETISTALPEVLMQTEGARETHDWIMTPLTKLGELGTFVGEKVVDVTDNVVLGATAKSMVEILPLIFGLKGVRKTAGIVKAVRGKKTKAIERSIVEASEDAGIPPELAEPIEALKEKVRVEDYIDKTTPENITPEALKKLALDESGEVAVEFPEAIESINKKAIKSIAQDTKNVASQFGEWLDEALGVISTRLENIAPELKYKLRNEVEFATRMAEKKDVKKVSPLIEKVNKLPLKEKMAYDTARKNGDTAEIVRINKEYGLEKEYLDVRKTLDDIRVRANETGLDVPHKQFYHPRIVKDYKGMMKHLRKNENWGEIQDSIRKHEVKIGRTLSEAEMVDYVNQNLTGIGERVSFSTRHTKGRKIDLVDRQLDPFYMDSNSALLNYIANMNDVIYARKFFGKVPTVINKSMAIKKRLKTRLDKVQKTKEPNIKQVRLLKQRIKVLDEKIDRAKNSSTEDSIGAYVVKLLSENKIKPEQQTALTSILSARFNPKSMSGFWKTYKNLAYIDTMGSYTSAVTQIGDLAFALHKNGFLETGKSLPKAIMKKSNVSRKDIGIEHIAQEFVDTSKSAKVLNKVFDLTLLSKIDAIGKETLINSSLSKYQKMAVKNPKKLEAKISKVFGDETPQVIADLKRGKTTENVKMLLFNDLLDVQPVALSEMPALYLKMGKGKIAYQLKTYSIKLLDVYRQDVINQIKKPGKANKVKGLRNLIKLTSALVVANATADEIKDFMLKRKTSLSDKVVDNLLRLIGLSKFIVWTGRREGGFTAFAKQILPPFKMLDAIYKDVSSIGDEKGLDVVNSIPIFGKFYYWWFGKRSKKSSDKPIIKPIKGL